jgi:hypothetical protein
MPNNGNKIIAVSGFNQFRFRPEGEEIFTWSESGLPWIAGKSGTGHFSQFDSRHGIPFMHGVIW